MLLTVGFFFTIAACFIPLLMNNYMIHTAELQSTLTEENEKYWKDIPGSNNLSYYLSYYVYNCTNVEDVVFKNAKPNFTELGPIVYKESDTYENVTYNQTYTFPETNKTYDALTAVFNQSFSLVNASEIDLDSPIYTTN